MLGFASLAGLALFFAFAVDRDWFPPGGFTPLSAGFGAQFTGVPPAIFVAAADRRPRRATRAGRRTQ